MHAHQIRVHTFIGRGTVLTDAIREAERGLAAWYQEQTILVYAHGGSVFQPSTAAYEYAGQFVFIITVFDARLEEPSDASS